MIFDQQAVVSVKKILMPIDRCDYNRKIVVYRISLSKAWGAEITRIHVIDMGRGVGYSKVEEKKQERVQEAKKLVEDLLNEIPLLAKKGGVSIRKDVIEENDRVGKAIIDYAM
jgi:hypothetical protein